MKTPKNRIPARHALAAAMALAALPAAAQTADRFMLLTTPESSLRAGAGYLDGEGARFGQYGGLTDPGAYGLIDIDLVRRDNATGTWLTLFGRDLGLDSREAIFDLRRQGDWRFTAAWSQTPRTSQYIVNTGQQGVGTGTLHVQPTGHRGIVPDTMRKRGTLAFERDFGNGFTVALRASGERKEGTRIFGRGSFSGGAVFNSLLEPVDRTTYDLDASVGYVAERFQLQAGYKGSIFDSHATALFLTGGGAALNGPGVGTFSPLSLAPGNEAHHGFVSGAWNLGPGSTVRGNFKLAYTRATQDEPFVANPTGVADSATTGNISGRRDLGGDLRTTLAYASIGARPLTPLDLNVSARHEDRDDRTPLARYIAVTGAATTDGYNEPRSVRFTSGKASAGYRLPAGFKVVAAVDFERQDRETSPVRVVAHRDRVDEATFRVDLRRAFSETLNGTLAAATSRRDGSEFVFTTRLDGTPYSNLIAPVFLADRERDKLRLDLDWQALEALNIQLQAESTRDRYDTRFDLGLGVRRGRSSFVALDAQYALSRDWRLTAWVSHARNDMAQATTVGARTAPPSPEAGLVQSVWAADLALKSDAVGVGVRGTIRPKIRLGADLQHTRDRSAYGLTALTGNPIADLPTIAYDVTTLRLWGLYEVTGDFGVRLDYAYDRRRIDDWTWRGFVYTPAVDGTTLATDAEPRVHFIGVSGYWRWR